MYSLIDNTTTSVPSITLYEPPESFLHSMGMLILHIAIAGAILAFLIGLLVISHTIYMRYFKKEK